VALARRLAGELRHLRSSRRLLKGAAALVVAGGGQLDDFFGGPFGQPYALFRWGLLARSVGARFCFASVGTGTLSTLASRWFVRRALSLADYRSFRDDRSRELVGAPALTHLDPTVPDLAYALPVQPEPAPGRPHLCVGLAPMAFCDPRQWPVEDQRRYQRHVRSFGALAKALLAEGHEVVLFTTDNEPGALEDTAAAIGPLTPGRLRIEPASSLPALFRTYAGVDVVVAARLHSTLLAHLAHRPVLAVSHERKVRALMEEMGLGRFCVEIDEFEAQTGLALLHELAAARGQVAAALGAAVEERRRRVEAQYDLLFGEAS
jgi:polysaccharide pyruvyl transferase WcaK-like protein